VWGRKTQRVWGGGGQEDGDSDVVGQEQHEDLVCSNQEHRGGFADDDGGKSDGSAAGSVSRQRWFRRSHIVAPPVLPRPDNRVLSIHFGDG
jgi:hypothetical protein